MLINLEMKNNLGDLCLEDNEVKSDEPRARLLNKLVDESFDGNTGRYLSTTP